MRANLGISMRYVALVSVLLAGTRSIADAQLPNASSAAFAMGGNFTAMARGFEAIAWNPANLAMPGRPLISVGAAIIGGNIGLAPVDFTTLHKFSGVVVDSATRVAWVDQARLVGGQSVKLDAALTPLAFTVGPIGFQYGGTVYTDVNLSPDAWEAVLFGNAGRSNGQPKTLDFTGTSVRVGAFSSAAMSFAIPIPINLTNGLLPDEHAAIALTGKYVMGHGLIVAEDNGSALGASDIQLRFPMILPDSNYKGNLGNGAAADLSIAWSGGPWKVGVLAENVFNAFKWDTTVLAFAPGTGTFNTSSSATDFDQQSYANAPASLRDIVAKQKFAPATAVGVAFKLTPGLTLTADMKRYYGDANSIVIGPRQHFGVGAEWKLLPFIPLRAGVASVTDGWQAGAGLGVHVLGFEFGASTSIRKIGAATQSGLMIGVVGIGR